MSKPLSQWSQRDLADALGDANTERKAAQNREEALKDEIKRRGLSSLKGTRYKVSATQGQSARLDSKRLQEEKPKTYANYVTMQSRTTITVKALEDA